MHEESVSEMHYEVFQTVSRAQTIIDYKFMGETGPNKISMEGIASNIPGMVFQLQQTGATIAFTYVSEGSGEVCGFAADSVVADPLVFLELLHRDDRDEFHDSRIRSMEDLSLWNWEGRLELVDPAPAGKWTKWVNLRARPRRIDSTTTVWDGIVFNISLSKEHEAEIRQSQEMLRALSNHQIVVREEEEKRIAHEIHDELGQRLTVLRMDLMMLPKSVAEPSVPMMETVDRMKETIDGIVRIARDISTHLRPAVLDIGLPLAVEWLLDDFRARLGIPCEFNNWLDDGIVLDDERTTNIFRILQESLTNIARHANARHIEVTLEIVDRRLHLHVNDDGMGFESKRDGVRKKFGLSGMRERAVALGGELKILSSPGNGTSVFASIPLSGE